MSSQSSLLPTPSLPLSQCHFPFLILVLPKRLGPARRLRRSRCREPSPRRLVLVPKRLRPSPPAAPSQAGPPPSSLHPSFQRRCRCKRELEEHDDGGDPDSVHTEPVLPRREEPQHDSAAAQGGAGGSEECGLLVCSDGTAEGHSRCFQVRPFLLLAPLLTFALARRASKTNPQYQVRLFCTNEEYFNPSRSASAQQPAPIDFPGTCEIKLNNLNVVANTKGIKKQAGTAPPVNLSQAALTLASEVLNKVEVIYVNTEKVRCFLLLVVREGS